MLTVDEFEVGHAPIAGLVHLAPDHVLCRAMPKETREEAVRMEIQNCHPSVRFQILSN